MEDIKNLTTLYRHVTGTEPEWAKALTPAGSNRRYYRIGGATATLVGVAGTSKEENDAFVYLSRHFSSLGLPVPEVKAVSDDGMSYIITDLGDRQLFSCLAERDFLEKSIRMLASLHIKGCEGLDFRHCFPVEAFDEQSVMWDLNYFKYSYLNTTGISYSEPHLQADFERLAADVAAMTRQKGVFMHRDFQSRNVMIAPDGTPWMIDFQGGRKGPAAYDIASFIHQARAGFDTDTREWLIDIYIDEATRLGNRLNPDTLRYEIRLMALVRSLQTLGAYGLRGKTERKSHFLRSIPPALAGLKRLTEKPFDRYPYLMKVIELLTNQDLEQKCDGFEGLTVRVSSFSYKKGIPEDPSGNGGGFVFDCRAMDNPGRYEQYRSLTGLDREVIDFLEQRGEITTFLNACYSLVDAAVDNYLTRGFTSLTVSYGCTGGQHRSVYSAQHTAEHIKKLHPEVRVILCHREQSIHTIL